MKAVIMAGGFGKRAQSIDPTIPKPLIQIAGKPILQYEVECLVSQGFTDIILTVSYMADKIEEFFGNGSKFGAAISYFYEEEPLGNAGALFRLWERGELSGDFLLLNADAMFDIDFGRFVRFHQEHQAVATLFTHPNSHPFDSGLIIAEDGVVKQWLTKEDERPVYYKNRVNAGLHILNTEILGLSNINGSQICSKRKVDLDRDILKPLVPSGRIVAYDSPEYVKDMGTPERFEQVSKDIASGRVRARNLRNPQKAIFLDRDGTINKHIGFLKHIDEFELLPGVAEAIRRVNDAGYLCIVVTNQPVIARGELTVGELNEIHNKMETLLGNAGAFVDALYYCPHHPDKGYEGEVSALKIDCDCRKPKPGMLLQAAKDFHIDLSNSVMIGDTMRDVQAGINAGCHTILLSDGEHEDFGQDDTVKLLFDAVALVLE